MKLRGYTFLYFFFGLCDIRNEAVFQILEYSSPRGIKQKKRKEKHEILAFKPLLQEIRLEILTIRKSFWGSNI